MILNLEFRLGFVILKARKRSQQINNSFKFESIIISKFFLYNSGESFIHSGSEISYISCHLFNIKCRYISIIWCPLDTILFRTLEDVN
jgi:hypothetical protein